MEVKYQINHISYNISYDIKSYKQKTIKLRKKLFMLFYFFLIAFRVQDLCYNFIET